MHNMRDLEIDCPFSCSQPGRLQYHLVEGASTDNHSHRSYSSRSFTYNSDLMRCDIHSQHCLCEMTAASRAPDRWFSLTHT